MSETTAEYIQRVRGYLGNTDARQSMQSIPTTLTNLLRGVPESVLTRPPAPGKWSIQEIVAHLADAELVTGFRYRAIVGAEDGVPIAAYDQNRWASAGNYAAAKLEESLKSFFALREMNLRFLSQLPASAWEKYGIHAERGRETLRDVVQLLAGHDLNHLGQIKKILSTAQAA
jgi:uncharacterized damage-inducible protein DinB